jgi:hypothetical protein
MSPVHSGVAQIQGLLVAAQLDDPQSQRENAALPRRLSSLPGSGKAPVGTTLPVQRRKPDLHLPLGEPMPSGPRPRPRLDTTEYALLSLGGQAGGVELPTPVLSAALGASPLSATSSGPVTPGTNAKLRSPSIMSLSPTANPYQVLMPPPPVPAIPGGAHAVGPPSSKMPAPLRAWTSMSHIDEDGVPSDLLRSGGLSRSQSEQNVLSTLPVPIPSAKTGESISGHSLRPVSDPLFRWPGSKTRGVHLACVVR